MLNSYRHLIGHLTDFKLYQLTKILMIAVLSLSLATCHMIESKSEVISPADDLDVLEVIDTYKADNGLEVSLINLKNNMRYHTVINADNVSNSVLDDFSHLEVGDRVQIDGEFQENSRFGIANINYISKVVNPDKIACESISGQVWRPEGKTRIPTCVTTYKDAGQSCNSSEECEGNCMVHETIETAACSSSSSRFGCGATIEAFEKNGLIMCVD